MDMGGGRLFIRFIILVLVVVLVWKVWEYSDLPAAESPPAFEVSQPLGEGNRGKEDMEVDVSPPMRVVVYYEALCPDSRYFIVKHLTPTYAKLHNVMTVAFVPYGKAKTYEKDGKYTFTCQHGPVECKANMVHACVTNSVKDEAKQVAIVNCMIEKKDAPLKIGQKCVEEHEESWPAVEECVGSEKGSSIMKHMGDMTNSLHPKVTFIPTIAIDGSLSEQSHILQDLHKVLCKRYKGPKPASC